MNGAGTPDSETSADELAVLEARTDKRRRKIVKASPYTKKFTKRTSSQAGSGRGKGACC